MKHSRTFEELDKSLHDRALFDCGEKALNDFIQTRAAKHMQAGISRTMVLPALTPLPNQRYPICAFYTIAPSSISHETLPQVLAKKLPCYPIPVFLLAQLAVHKEFHGTGLGKVSLIKALEYFWEINSHMRAYAIVVDCLTIQAESFYIKYGFEFLCRIDGKARMYIPMKTVGQLFNKM